MAGLAERRKYILDSIVRDGLVKVADLAATLGVTQTTIRKDLNYLEEQGLLYRAYGSALPTTIPVMDINLNNKKLINFETKQRIARVAASLIEENDSIILSSGSSIAVFAEAIKPKGRLNVVTTAVNISMTLGDVQGVTVMQVGGLLYSNTLSVVGNDAIQEIKSVFCSKLFFGVDGFSLDHGFTCGTVEEADLTQQMIKSAEKAIVLVDSSKLGKKGFARICSIDKVSTIITDSGLPEETRRLIEALGVRVIIA